jgi:hypothetical protein
MIRRPYGGGVGRAPSADRLLVEPRGRGGRDSCAGLDPTAGRELSGGRKAGAG